MFTICMLVVISPQLVEVSSSVQLSQPIPLNLGVHLFVDNQYLQNTSSLEFHNGLVQKNTNDPIVYPEYP